MTASLEVGKVATLKDYALEERTIGRILADKAQRIPQQTCLIWEGRRYSYAQAEELSNRYANGFAAQGIGHGDHVAVILPNCAEYLWVVWGLGKIGAVAVTVNTAAKGEMLRYFIDQSDAVCVVIDAEWFDRYGAVAAQLPKVRQVFLRGAAAVLSAGPATGAQDFALLESSDASVPPLDRVRHDDTHVIVYTSGTTGPSKGVLCPHSQGHAVGRAVSRDYGYRPDDVLYTCLPLFHVNALWYTCLAALWADATIALSARFSASTFWDEIRATGATQFNSLGAMSSIILKIPPGPGDRQHALRQCMVVPMHREVYQEIRERYGVKVTSLFAMSENYSITSFLPDDRPDKAGSAGSARGESELRIVDDEGRDLAPGEVGEILLRPVQPGCMMKGYYRMPEATQKAFVDGWFCTGDRAWLDADGYLYFVDRKKEAIRRRGENISAYEVELILARHPAIQEVAAVPVASEMSEDEVMVYVVRRPGAALTEAEVVHFAIEHMSYFMVPRFVAFIEALPKTSTEKIEKYKLKQDAIERRAQLWDREREGIVVRR